MLPQIKKYFQAFSAKGTNALPLKFEASLNVELRDTGANGYLCAGSLAPLADARSVATVRCPLDGTVFERAGFSGKVCETCQLCRLGEEALGLNNMVELE